jgi:hypothetical protein
MKEWSLMFCKSHEKCIQLIKGTQMKSQLQQSWLLADIYNMDKVVAEEDAYRHVNLRIKGNLFLMANKTKTNFQRDYESEDAAHEVKTI